MNRKKVLILGKLPPPYMGPSIATQILLQSDLKNRFELSHLNTKINDTISSLGKWNLGKIMRNFSVYYHMLHLLIIRKPDVVLIPISQTTTGFIKDSFFIKLASLFNKKIVIQLRGSDFKNWLNQSSPKVKRFVEKSIRRTHGVIVLGTNLKYLFADYFPDNRIFVIPNGGNYHFPSVIKNETTVRLLYFSNLLESKGIEDVFQAIRLLKPNTQVSFTLDCVGEWASDTIRQKCLALVQEYHLPIQVHPPKSGDEKMNLLASADVFVFPPREPEGHPWAIVEAMAAGLPIISTNQGAIIESVIDQQNGFIVEPKHPEQIAGKLQLLLENPSLRKTMGNASRQLYLENFTEEKMVEKYSHVFHSLISYDPR